MLGRETRKLSGFPLEVRAAWQPQAPWVAVLAHPYPPLGGDMDNNVIRLLAHYLARRHYSTLRFNLRGVGTSPGRFVGDGREWEDVAAAWRAAREGGTGKLVAIGYSYGAWLTWEAARHEAAKPEALVLIAPPLASTLCAFSAWACAVPLLVVAGDADTIAGPGDLTRAFAELGAQAEAARLPAADHLLIGREAELAERILAFLAPRS